MEVMSLTTGSATFKDEFAEDEIVHIIRGDIESVKSFFLEKQYEGQRNSDFVFARQWSDLDVKAHENQFRKAYVFNEVQRIVDSLLGTQTQTRLDTKVQPRESSDESAAETLNNVMKWIEQVNKLEYTETSVFYDGLVKGRGACVLKWSSENLLEGYPEIKKINPDELFWDINTSSMDLSDARWAARVMKMTRQDLCEIFPDRAEDILKSGTFTYNNSNVVIDSYKNLYRQTHSSTRRRDLITVVEHYERIKALKYLVYDEIADKKELFDDANLAEDYYNSLVEAYSDLGTPIVDSYGNDLVAYVVTNSDVLLQTVLIDDKVFIRTISALPSFPWIVYFPYFSDGDFYAMVNNLISPQELLNRSFSQLDYQLGTAAKNVMLVVEPLLGKSWRIEDVRREMAKTSSVIPVANAAAVTPFPNQPVNPEIFNNIQFARDFINVLGGGKNVLGLQENANESGKAIQSRVAQAGINRLPLFDNLRYWRQQVAMMAIWYVKNFMSSGQQFRITGTTGEPIYVELDEEILGSLREMQYDIIIDEASKTEVVKERQLQQYIDLVSRMPNAIPPNLSLDIYLELSDIPLSIKTKIRESMQFYQDQQQQQMQAQKEQQIQQSAQDQILKRNVKDQLVAAQQAQAIQEQGYGAEQSTPQQINQLSSIMQQQ